MSNVTEYVKSIKLKFDADMKSLNYVREQIKRKTADTGALKDALAVVEQSPFSKENIETLKKLRAEIAKQEKENITAKKVLEGQEEVKEKIKDTFTDAFSKVASSVKKFFISEFTAAIKELRSIASYDLASSSTYSSEAWSMLKTYGVTGSDAYALSKAMSDIGVSSQSELMEALLQPEVYNRFSERLAYWQNNYSDAQETGKMINDFVLEWQDFKQELMMDFVNWFVKNKESIKAGLKLVVTLLEKIAVGIGKIASLFSKNQNSSISSASDIIQNYTTSSTNTTNNNVNIAVNGTNSSSVGQNIYNYLQTKLSIK